MTVTVILNRQAGSLIALSPAEVRRQVAAWFADAGMAVEVIASPPGPPLAAAIERALADRAEALIVGGGDGTVASAAGRLAGTDTALGVLPLGTLNLLAKDLEIPLDLPAAIRALAGAWVRAIDVAEVNGHVYLNNSVLGLYPSIAQARERLRAARGWRRWLVFVKVVARTIWFHNRLKLELEIDGRPRRVVTVGLVIANNTYHADTAAAPDFRTLDEGVLSVYISRHRGRFDLLRLLVTVPLGGWQHDRALEITTARTVVVHGRRRRLKVAFDGEVMRMAPPLVYRVRPRALKVLVPAGTPRGTPPSAGGTRGTAGAATRTPTE